MTLPQVLNSVLLTTSTQTFQFQQNLIPQQTSASFNKPVSSVDSIVRILLNSYGTDHAESVSKEAAAGTRASTDR